MPVASFRALGDFWKDICGLSVSRKRANEPRTSSIIAPPLTANLCAPRRADATTEFKKLLVAATADFGTSEVLAESK